MSVVKQPKCPTCHEVLDRHMSANRIDAIPRKDDYSICSYCLEVLQFNRDMTLRVAKNIPPEIIEQRNKLEKWRKIGWN